METPRNTPAKRSKPRVLLLYYSFSGQTVGVLNRLAAGLKEQGAVVVIEKIRPMAPLRFPIGTVFSTIKMMLTTFLRCRVAIEELSPAARGNFDLIILAGPTWSYNPSGPVLALLDRDGSLFKGQTVLPLISCRGYWRMHWIGLRRLLENCGATIPNVIVFSHPNKEPWRTIGVFLKLAGKRPERSPFFGRYYIKYGHSKEQLHEAWRFGLQIAESLKEKLPLTALHFNSKTSRP